MPRLKSKPRPCNSFHKSHQHLADYTVVSAQRPVEMNPCYTKKKFLAVGVLILTLCIVLYQWYPTGLNTSGRRNSLKTKFGKVVYASSGSNKCVNCGFTTEGTSVSYATKRIPLKVTPIIISPNTRSSSQTQDLEQGRKMQKILNILTNRRKRNRYRENQALRQCPLGWQERYKKLHDDILHSRRPPRFLIYHCGGVGHGCGTYGDRMEAIASVFFMAVLTQRAFLIHWNTSASIDKFLQPHNIMWNASIANFQGMQTRRHYWGIGNHEKVTNDVQRLPVNSSTFLNWLKHEDLRTFLTSPTEIITSVWYFAPDLQNNKFLAHAAEQLGFKFRGNRYSPIGCAFNFLFLKKPELESRLSNARRFLGFTPETIKIGINIRLADTAKMLDFFARVKALQNVIIAASSKVSAKDVKWFLVSDVKHVKSYGQKKYKGKLVTLPVKIERIATSKASYRGMLGIMLDNFILSECDFLITSLNSFTKTALGLRFASERFTIISENNAYLIM